MQNIPAEHTSEICRQVPSRAYWQLSTYGLQYWGP